MNRISDPRSVIVMDPDMDQPIKNSGPIRSDKINEYRYGYGYRPIRSEPDPLTSPLTTIQLF